MSRQEAIDHALKVALHSSHGAKEFWRSCRRRGMTDGELLPHVNAAMGNNLGLGGGGMVGAGKTGFGWRTCPARLWLGLGGNWSRRKPALQGEALLARARRLLRIPGR